VAVERGLRRPLECGDKSPLFDWATCRPTLRAIPARPAFQFASWTAPAKRSVDGAFARPQEPRAFEDRRPHESGVALRFPPQSMTPRATPMRDRSGNPKGIESSSSGLASPRAYPGSVSKRNHQPQRGCGLSLLPATVRLGHNRVAVGTAGRAMTQGRPADSPTLSFGPESRWDSGRTVPIGRSLIGSRQMRVRWRTCHRIPYTPRNPDAPGKPIHVMDCAGKAKRRRRFRPPARPASFRRSSPARRRRGVSHRSP